MGAQRMLLNARCTARHYRSLDYRRTAQSRRFSVGAPGRLAFVDDPKPDGQAPASSTSDGGGLVSIGCGSINASDIYRLATSALTLQRAGLVPLDGRLLVSASGSASMTCADQAQSRQALVLPLTRQSSTCSSASIALPIDVALLPMSARDHKHCHTAPIMAAQRHLRTERLGVSTPGIAPVVRTFSHGDWSRSKRQPIHIWRTLRGRLNTRQPPSWLCGKPAPARTNFCDALF